MHAAESHLSASVSSRQIYLCDESGEREERRLPRVSARQTLHPRESPFSLPLELLSPFFFFPSCQLVLITVVSTGAGRLWALRSQR